MNFQLDITNFVGYIYPWPFYLLSRHGQPVAERQRWFQWSLGSGHPGPPAAPWRLPLAYDAHLPLSALRYTSLLQPAASVPRTEQLQLRAGQHGQPAQRRWAHTDILTVTDTENIVFYMLTSLAEFYKRTPCFDLVLPGAFECSVHPRDLECIEEAQLIQHRKACYQDHMHL